MEMTKNKSEPAHMKLEVIIIPVSDVDRAKAFYAKLGFRLDGDFVVNEKLRVLQFTPPRSEASVIFGKGVSPAKPGSIKGLVLAVDNIDAARAELIARGAEVSEVFTTPTSPLTIRWTTHGSAGATQRLAPTSLSPHSRIQTGISGSSKRSQRAFLDESGK